MCKKTNYKIPNPRIDKCMRPLIEWLLKHDYAPVASCCGHGHKDYSMTIVVRWIKNKKIYYQELFSEVIIPRTRNFYKRDEQGYYYIPELNQSKEKICECGHKQWEEHKSSFYEKNKDLKMVAQECNVKGCKCKKFKLRKPNEVKKRFLEGNKK